MHNRSSKEIRSAVVKNDEENYDANVRRPLYRSWPNFKTKEVSELCIKNKIKWNNLSVIQNSMLQKYINSSNPKK